MIVSKREKRFFIITLSIILLSLIYAFIIEPLYKRYISLNQQIKVKQIELTKNLKVISERDVVMEEFERYGQYFASKGLNQDMAFLLSEIEKIGKVSGIYLNDVKPERVKDIDFYKIVSVEIKFQATAKSLTEFIYELQNSKLLLKVGYLQLCHKGENQSLLEGIIRINKICF